MLKYAPTCFSCGKEDQPVTHGYRIWKWALQLGDKEHLVTFCAQLHKKQSITLQQAIDEVNQAVKHLNPGQTAVDAYACTCKTDAMAIA